MSDDVTHRNILAISSYSEETRQVARDTQKELEVVRRQLQQLRVDFDLLRTQMQTLQVKMFSGGTTSGNND